MGPVQPRPDRQNFMSHFLHTKDQHEKAVADLVKGIKNFKIAGRNYANILIVGLSGSGKSSLINTIVRSLALEQTVTFTQDENVVVEKLGSFHLVWIHHFDFQN